MILAIRKSINVLLPSLTCLLSPNIPWKGAEFNTHTQDTTEACVVVNRKWGPPPSLMGGVGVSVYFFLCMCTETWNPGDYREPRAPQIQVSFSMTIEAHSILNQTPHLWFLTHGRSSDNITAMHHKARQPNSTLASDGLWMYYKN